MQRLEHKQVTARRRAYRVRSRVVGTTERPRLNIHISHQHVTAQIIDDSKQATIAYASTIGSKQTGSLSTKAQWVGTQIAAKAKQAKIKQVSLDRGAKLYHGRIEHLAKAAREAGLEF